jgi:hypothetical protein
MIVKNNITRRLFVRSASALLALPYLETFADEKNSKINKKMLFLSLGYGFVEKSFYPDKAGKFSEIGLTKGLKNLEEHQNDVTLLGNLVNKGGTNPHTGSLTLLTGAEYAGRKTINTVSCDQVAAQYLCKDTRYTSYILSTRAEEARAAGHDNTGGCLSLSWGHNGKPLTGHTECFKAYSGLFSNNQDTKAILRRIESKRSILDDLKLNVKSLTKNISHSDKDKLDEYFQAIRQIELSLSKEITWSSVPKPKAPFKFPEKNKLEGEAEIKLMFDLMLLALQTEQTRVTTYMLPASSLLKEMGIKMNAHTLSHSTTERTPFAEQRDAKYMELYSYLISKLKSTRDREGKSIYDSSTLCFGTNIRSTHTMTGMPMFLTGGGIKNLRRGESLFLRKDTPLQNVWLTLLQENGIPIKRFSSSTGNLSQLLV